MGLADPGPISAMNSSRKSTDRLADAVAEDEDEELEGMATTELLDGGPPIPAELFSRPRALRLPARELLEARWLAKDVLDVR